MPVKDDQDNPWNLLTEPQKRCVKLLITEGLSVSEAAKQEGVTARAIYYRMQGIVQRFPGANRTLYRNRKS